MSGQENGDHEGVEPATDPAPTGPIWPQGFDASIDERERTAHLTYAGGDDVDLNDVTGWNITLDISAARDVTVRTRPSADAELHLSGPFNRRVSVESPGTLVVIEPTTAVAHIQLLGETDQLRIVNVVDNLNVTLNSEQPTAVQVTQTAQSRRPLVLTGDAVLRSLAGEGPVIVSLPVVTGTSDARHPLLDGFTGRLDVRAAISGVELVAAAANLNVTSITDCLIETDTLSVEAEMQNCIVTAATKVSSAAITESDVTVTDSLPGPAIIAGAVPDDAAPVSPDWINSQHGTPNNARGGPVLNSILRCHGEGDIQVGTVTGQTTIHAGGAVVCAGAVTTEGRGDDEIAIEAGAGLRVEADLVLTGRTAVTNGRCFVRGAVSAGTIRAKAEVQLLGGATDVEIIGSSIQVGQTVTNGSLIATGPVHIGGDINGTAVSGTEVVTQGDLNQASLTVGRKFEMPSNRTADDDTELELRGTGTLPDGFSGWISWSPTQDDDVLTIVGTPRALTITSPDRTATLKVTPQVDARWPIVTLTGRAAVELLSANQNAPAPWIPAVVSLRSSESMLLIGGRARVELNVDVVPGSMLGRSTAGDSDDFIVNLSGAQGLRVFCGGNVRVVVPDALPEVDLIVTGPAALTVEGALGKLTGEAYGTQFPKLNVPDGSVVNELRGDINLGQIGGRVEVPVTGPPVRRPAAPVVHGIDKQERPTGHVVGINPTEIPDSDLEHAKTLHVFAADPKAIKKWAKKKHREPNEARSAAARAQRIAEQVRSTAASGGARSTAQWAAARTHHAALDSWAVFERIPRWVHRLFGYSQRPGPPLLTYVFVALAWWASLGAFDLASDGRHGRYHGLIGAATVLGKVFILPASWLLRIPEDDKGAHLFREHYLEVIAFVTTGLPFVFFIIALRNFMSAADRSVS